MPLTTRVWRTNVNWLDANRIGMTFSFLFRPAALTFLATLRRRRTNSLYLNTLFGAAGGCASGGLHQLYCSHCARLLRLRHERRIRPRRDVRFSRAHRCRPRHASPFSPPSPGR